MPDDSKDSLSMMYFSNPEVFADIYNYVLYSGEQVITPDSLTELDPVELVPSQKTRHPEAIGLQARRERHLRHSGHRGADQSRLRDGHSCHAL